MTQILAVFVKLFHKSRDENEQLAEAERKKLEKEAMKEKAAAAAKKEGLEDRSKLHAVSRKHISWSYRINNGRPRSPSSGIML